MLEITDMINQEDNDRKRSILISLRVLNKKAYLHMKQSNKTYKQKYREMWRKPFWKEAKVLLREYFEVDGPLTCKLCNRKIQKTFTLHHEEDFYKIINIFNPNVVMLVHNGCHGKHHEKGTKWSRNKK